MTPAGIVAGTAVSPLLSTHAGLLFEAVFDSVGAGTFIYIAALDITRTEFDTPEDRWPKWVCATAGFAAMAVLAIWLLPPARPRQIPARTARHSTRTAAGTMRGPWARARLRRYLRLAGIPARGPGRYHGKPGTFGPDLGAFLLWNPGLGAATLRL